MYSEKNNKNIFEKLRSRVYVTEKKQKNDKNIDNNEKTENSLKTERHKSDYYVTD